MTYYPAGLYYSQHEPFTATCPPYGPCWNHFVRNPHCECSQVHHATTVQSAYREGAAVPSQSYYDIQTHKADNIHTSASDIGVKLPSSSGDNIQTNEAVNIHTSGSDNDVNSASINEEAKDFQTNKAVNINTA